MFSIAICRQFGDKWQSKTMFLAFFDIRSSIVLTFSIVAYPVWYGFTYLLNLQNQSVNISSVLITQASTKCSYENSSYTFSFDMRSINSHQIWWLLNCYWPFMCFKGYVLFGFAGKVTHIKGIHTTVSSNDSLQVRPF